MYAKIRIVILESVIQYYMNKQGGEKGNIIKNITRNIFILISEV